MASEYSNALNIKLRDYVPIREDGANALMGGPVLRRSCINVHVVRTNSLQYYLSQCKIISLWDINLCPDVTRDCHSLST